MKRILTLDGGGIRGLFTLQILARIEGLFRREHDRSDLVLADVFDMFAGTSTGAIIATCLGWGMQVAEIEEIYLAHGAAMFTLSPWFRRWKSKYRAEKLEQMFQEILREDDVQKSPALLGTAKLRGILLVVMRNASTGSPWPVTNNPQAMYNDRSLSDCNLNIPLWKLLRASTAAPTYFAPESIKLGERQFLFVDGGITPYNNPSLIAVLTATLPTYRLCWPASAESLLVVSVGTGGVPARLPNKLAAKINILDQLGFVPAALMDSISDQQDLMCRILGDCQHGALLDSEVGDIRQPTLFSLDQQKFTYVRYDTRLSHGSDATLLPGTIKAALDDLTLIPFLQRIGKAYAAEHVELGHLYPRRPVSAS